MVNLIIKEVLWTRAWIW